MSEYNDICLLEDEEKEESGPSSSTSQSITEEIPIHVSIAMQYSHQNRALPNTFLSVAPPLRKALNLPR